MKLVFSIFAVLLLSFPALAQDYPKDPETQRKERRSGAFQKALGQTVTEKKFADCYYRMSGCKEGQRRSDKYSWPSRDYPPSQYPKDGYMLDYDGMYRFKPGAQSR